MSGLLKVPGCSVFCSTETTNLDTSLKQVSQERFLVFTIDQEDLQLDVPIIPLPVTSKEEPVVQLQFFDTIVQALANEDEKTQCIFISKDLQLATLGMVCACAVKGVQTINKMRQLVEEGIAEKDWVEAIVRSQFEAESHTKEDNTPLLQGQFDIVRALVNKLPEAQVGKILVDKMIDLAGQLEGEKSGVNLRRVVLEIQSKMEEATGEDQVQLKKSLLRSLEIYFYLVCFGSYLRTEGPGGFKTNFVTWVQERPFLPDMVETGIKVWEEITFFSLSMSLPA